MTDKNQAQPKLTKEQILDSIKQYVNNNQGMPILDGIKTMFSNSGNDVVADIFGVSSISAVYVQLAAVYPEHKDELLNAARSSNPYFVNDTSKFLQFINRDWSTSRYSCNVFMQDGKDKAATPVDFPNGTLSYLGARTHRGKTTALISIALDALIQGKTVYFYTNEETPEQIISRLIKARLFFNVCPDYSGTDDELATLIKSVPDDADLNREIADALKTNPDPNKKVNYTQLQKLIQRAFADVSQDLFNHKMNIIDGLKQKFFEDVTDSLNLLNAGDVVLFDYIQHTRRPQAATAQLQIAKVSQDIADIAANKDLVIIAGAQLNRDAENDDDDDKPQKVSAPDKLGMQYMREAGDLEQDANIIIEIGHQAHPDTDRAPTRFYKICKQRNHAADDRRYLLDDKMRFSLFGCKVVGSRIDYFIPEMPEPKPNTRKPYSKGKNVATDWNASGKELTPDEYL